MESRGTTAWRGVDPFLGSCPVVVEFLARLRRAAESDSTVLILGESGVGKSAAAARLHAWSSRARGPLVAVSLVATSGTLIEATLFGHERGAFTDAHRSRSGIFRRANGGTVVLDDIEHLPLETQVKLLRVLQERVVEPLGAETSVPVDVRIVATASQPLERAVEAGRFRSDLYYRLAVLPLEVPPLRARREDLADLAKELLARLAQRVGVAPRAATGEALQLLRAHGWPGNLRELENTLERVLVLGEERVAPIAPEELYFLSEAVAGREDELARQALAAGLTIEQMSRAMMKRALEEHRGNVSAAARSLGMTRRAFDYRRNQSEAEEHS
jgi:DNA-binding NtrC family response regulator